MANNLRCYTTSGQTLYAVLFGETGLVWNGTEFDWFAVGSWATYAIPLTELAAGIYFGNMPTSDYGAYDYVVYAQAGGSPAVSDTLVAANRIEWDGYGIISLYDLYDAIQNAVPSPLQAQIMGAFGMDFPSGAKQTISGNDITVNWDLDDDSDSAYIGWMVFFDYSKSGFPTIDGRHQTTVTAQSGSTITVASMPPYDLTYTSFTVYLFPPGWAAGGGGGATAEDVAAAILVTPANKIATEAGGAISTLFGHTPQTGDSYLRLGAPAGASVTADIAAVKGDTAAILVDTDQTLPALFAASGATVTVISAVSGGTITVYVADTWSFTVTDSTLDLSGYEAVALSVKRNARQADAEALLYLRSDTGLQRIGGATPVSAGNGTLSKTSTSFTALVALAETGGLTAGQYTWWLKGFDTTPTPDTGFTLATGAFVLERAGLAAVA